MIAKTQKFMQGQWGKALLYTLMVAILYTGYGCTAYHQVPMAKTEFMANEQIQTALASYNVYLHDGANVYSMTEVQMVDGRDLTGRLAATTYEGPKSDWKRHERKEWWKDHKYDIHIYTNDNLSISADLSARPDLFQDRVTVSEQMIKDIQVMAYDTAEGVSDALVVVFLLAGIGLIVLLMILILDDNSVGGTGGGSDSGSGSNGNGSSD